MQKIKEIIVVEGRDDTAAIRRAVDAQTIETHGFGMSEEMWRQIDKAVHTRGIIVLTDPDYPGEYIRRQIRTRYPGCKEAFLPKSEALRDGDVGVENASPEAIRQALAGARAQSPASRDDEEAFTTEDLAADGLIGPGSRVRREQLGEALGIGYGNGKTFLAKLNGFGITRKEYYEAIRSCSDQSDQE
jgi:ribonuclease M5